MKAIILAAGKGSRLMPLTKDKPKCMVEYKGKQIIDYILKSIRENGINDVVVVKGYKAEKLQKENIKYYINERFAVSNMVYTLFCAENEFTDDIIISYADIVYKKNTLEVLLKDDSSMAVVIDKNWRAFWERRMPDPLTDAETLKLDKENYIIELGKKPISYKDVEGQYIGLLKIKNHILPQIIDYYHSLDRKASYDGKSFDNMYMTTFIQLIIDNVLPVKAVFIEGGWIEIDEKLDLQVDIL